MYLPKILEAIDRGEIRRLDVRTLSVFLKSRVRFKDAIEIFDLISEEVQGFARNSF